MRTEGNIGARIIPLDSFPCNMTQTCYLSPKAIAIRYPNMTPLTRNSRNSARQLNRCYYKRPCSSQTGRKNRVVFGINMRTARCGDVGCRSPIRQKGNNKKTNWSGIIWKAVYRNDTLCSEERRARYMMDSETGFLFYQKKLSLYPGIYCIDWLDKDCPSTISSTEERPASD